MAETTLRKWMNQMDVFDPHVEQVLIEEGIDDPINDFKTVTQPQWDHIKKATFNKSQSEELSKKMGKLEKYLHSQSSTKENAQHLQAIKHLRIGDRIEVKKGMFGIIKYIGVGPIPCSSFNSKGEVLGIELDIQIPTGHNGQDLFTCKKGHGYFSPRWRIKNVIKPSEQQEEKEPPKKLSIIEKMEQKFEEEQKQKLEHGLPDVPVIPMSRSHVKEFSHMPDATFHFLDKLKTVQDAEIIIGQSKEPFWGKLIKQLYDDGFSIDEMEEAFKRAHQEFKWSGQIQIWYQDTKPSCIEQLQFANGDGKPEYVKPVIEKLIEDNCRDKTPPPMEVVPMDDIKENENIPDGNNVVQNNVGN